jgi:hypothetical protein
MKVFNKQASDKYQVSRVQALNSIPVKNIQVSEESPESGQVIIHYLTTMRPWISKVIRRLGGAEAQPQTKKLQLDQLGTEVWKLIDGNRSVRLIIRAFAESNQLQIREAEVAVTQFIRELGKRGLIGLR